MLETELSPPVEYFYWPFQGGGSFALCMFCVCHAFVSVHCCLEATCLERADPSAIVGDVYCILLLSHVASWVRLGTWLYRCLSYFVLTLRRKVLTRTFQMQVQSARFRVSIYAIYVHISRTGHPKEASKALLVCHTGNDRGKPMV